MLITTITWEIVSIRSSAKRCTKNSCANQTLQNCKQTKRRTKVEAIGIINNIENSNSTENDVESNIRVLRSMKEIDKKLPNKCSKLTKIKKPVRCVAFGCDCKMLCKGYFFYYSFDLVDTLVPKNVNRIKLDSTRCR